MHHTNRDAIVKFFMHRAPQVAAVLCFTVSLLAPAPPLAAAVTTYTWNDADGTHVYSDGLNWNPNSPAGGPNGKDVTVNFAPDSSLIVIDVSATVANVTTPAGAHVTQNSGSELKLGNSLENDGQLALNGALDIPGNATVSGSGGFFLGGAVVEGAGTLTIETTITASGKFRVKNLVNQGTINVGSEGPLTFLNTSLDNEGTIFLGPGTKLDLDAGAGVDSGTISVDVGGLVNLSGGPVLNGVSLQGSGSLSVKSGTMNSVTNGLTINVLPNGTLTVTGNLFNSGTLNLGHDSSLLIGGSNALSGGGTVNFAKDGTSSILSAPATTDNYITNTDNWWVGPATLGDGNLAVTIDLKGSWTDNGSAPANVNSEAFNLLGRITVGKAATVNFLNPPLNFNVTSGTWTGGNIAAAGKVVVPLDIGTLEGGFTLQGGGTIEDPSGGSVFNGLANIANGGSLTVTNGATLDLDGPLSVAGSLDVTGASTKVSLVGSLDPALTVQGGTLTLDKGTISAPFGLTASSGKVVVEAANIQGDVTIGGANFVITPGTTNITGNLSDSSTSTDTFQFASDTSSGELNLTGSATLNGTAVFTLLGTYKPQDGTTAFLITAPSGLTGTFAMERTKPKSAGVIGTPSYGPTGAFVVFH